MCLGSVIVVGGKRVRGGEKCRDRDPRKDVLVNRRKTVFVGRSRDANVLVICARVWGPRDGKRAGAPGHFLC